MDARRDDDVGTDQDVVADLDAADCIDIGAAIDAELRTNHKPLSAPDRYVGLNHRDASEPLEQQLVDWIAEKKSCRSWRILEYPEQPLLDLAAQQLPDAYVLQFALQEGY